MRSSSSVTEANANEMSDYLQITSPTSWSLDGYADWCSSCEKLEGDKKKILDHVKKELERIINNNYIEEAVRQKATQLYSDLKRWKASKTAIDYFQRMEAEWQTKQQLTLIENEKTVKLAEIECMKIAQLQNHTKSAVEIQHQITCGFEDFAKKHSSRGDTMENPFLIDDDESERQALLHSAKNAPNECVRENKRKQHEIDDEDIEEDFVDAELDNDDISKFSKVEYVLATHGDDHGENLEDTFPKDTSPTDVWKLPSGYLAHDVVRMLPPGAHEYHPSQFSIIRLGNRVWRPQSIARGDWNYFQRSFQFRREPTSEQSEQILKMLAKSESPSMLKQELKSLSGKLSGQAKFFAQVLKMLLRNVFLPSITALRSKRAQESTLGTFLVHPLLNLVGMQTACVEYHPGEVYSQASASQRILRRRPSIEDDRPLGQKVDGLFLVDKTEFGLVEMSGGPYVHDLPRYIKDHVRGFWCLRDLLKDIAVCAAYCQGSFAIMRRVRVFFVHTHGLDIEIWTMDCPVQDLFRMYLIGTGRLPLCWEDKNDLISMLPILWDLKNGLVETATLLGMLKKSAGLAMAMSRSSNTSKHHQASSSLSRYISIQHQMTPSKPSDTKKARTLKPCEEYSSEDELQ